VTEGASRVSGPPPSARAGRPPVVRAAVTILGALAILSPVVLPRGWDSFPISSYPMFSRGDLGAVNELAHAVLVGRDGTRAPATPAMVGSPEPMIAMAIVRSHVERGSAAELCGRIAARAAEAGADAAAVEIVTSVFDARRYFSGDDGRAPLRREVHARCEVVR